MEYREWTSSFMPPEVGYGYYNCCGSTPTSSEDSDCAPSPGTSTVHLSNTYPSSRATALAPMLPPCRVCGERASGFHYGVNTCEACKGFFRRSLQKTEKYKCLGDGNCEVISSRRGSCSACRYNRCVSVGMSKEAIKTGRYTHEKRAKDIAEVKRLEQLRIGSGSSLTPGGAQCSGHSSTNTLSSSSDYYGGECEQLVQRMTSAYRHLVINWEKMKTERENEYLEQRALKERLFGKLKPVPRDEYMKIYETTGIDVDGRIDLMKGILLPNMEYRIKNFISFAKTVPGFVELPMEDQISIIKGTRFEVWLIFSHLCFNHVNRLYTTGYGRTICVEEMRKLHDEEYIDQIFVVNQRIRDLQLDYDETCVLAAFVMMSPDHCELLDKQRVESSQSILLRCLLYVLNKRQPDNTSDFVKIINILCHMRTLKLLHEREEEKLAAQWFDKLEIPPLVYEMWSS